MRTVIYLDILLAVNLILDFFLLLGAGKLSGCIAKKGRCVAAAAVAACGSLVLLLPPQPLVFQLGLKLAGSALPVWIAFGSRRLRQTGKAVLWYFLLNLLLAGAVLLWSVTLSPAGVLVNNLSLYFNISPVTLILSVLSVYLVIQLGSLLFGKPDPKQPAFVTLLLDGAQIDAPVLLDTGFALRDILNGRPCVLLSYPQVKNQLSARLRDTLERYFAGGPIDHEQGLPVLVVPCKTAAGESLLPALRCESGSIRYKKRSAAAGKITVAFTRQPIADGISSGLIGPELLESIL
ncbi:MAG TPA: sigma-E processing peptidase SpoIIGA [Candidatus Pygmaiobacter gallistercoris]|nr:sigma-E processing peptidase SpoIIGA [Candidatus Pygmaiobacter gallistercoris]